VAIAGAAGGDGRLGVGRELASGPFDREAGPPVSYLLDRVVREAATAGDWRGHSGAVRVIITEPGDPVSLPDTLGLDSLPALARLEIQQVDSPGVRSTAEEVGTRPGAWSVLVRMQGQVAAPR
jgi:hypothetical protein